MKKNFKVFVVMVLLALGFAGCYMIGRNDGAQDVINNQIVSSEDHKEGFYEVEYDGQLYRYWFEK